MGRLWIRYGEKAEIGETVFQEIEAAYPEERLQEIIRQANEEQSENIQRGRKVSLGGVLSGPMGN